MHKIMQNNKQKQANAATPTTKKKAVLDMSNYLKPFCLKFVSKILNLEWKSPFPKSARL